MGVSKLNIWVSDVADPCGTWDDKGLMTIFDCKGILHWPCGRYLGPEGNWLPVPDGHYHQLPFHCGHLEVEIPPGCYWVVSAFSVAQHGATHIHLNQTTHVGIVQVGCGDTACVKIFNPSIRICWNWFLAGILAHAELHEGGVDRAKAAELQRMGEELLKEFPHLPVERLIEGVFKDLPALTSRGKTTKP